MRFNRTMVMLLLLGLGTLGAYIGVRAHGGQSPPPPVVPPAGPTNDPLPLDDLQIPRSSTFASDMPAPKVIVEKSKAPWLLPTNPQAVPNTIAKTPQTLKVGETSEAGKTGNVAPAQFLAPPGTPDLPLAPPPIQSAVSQPPGVALPKIVNRDDPALVPMPHLSAGGERIIPVPVPEDIRPGLTNPTEVRPPLALNPAAKLLEAKPEIVYPSEAVKHSAILPIIVSPGQVNAPAESQNMIEIKQGTPPPAPAPSAPIPSPQSLEVLPLAPPPPVEAAVADLPDPAPTEPITQPPFQEAAPQPEISPVPTPSTRRTEFIPFLSPANGMNSVLPAQAQTLKLETPATPLPSIPDAPVIINGFSGPVPDIVNPTMVHMVQHPKVPPESPPLAQVPPPASPGKFVQLPVIAEDPPAAVNPGPALVVPNPEPKRFVLVHPLRHPDAPSPTPSVSAPASNVSATPALTQYTPKVPVALDIPAVKIVSPSEFANSSRATAPTFQQLAQPVQPQQAAGLNIQVKGPAQSQLGQPVVFDIRVVNGESRPVSNIVLHVNLSEGLQHSQGRHIEGDLGNLAPGAEKTIQLRTVAAQSGQQEFECSVTADNATRVSAQATIMLAKPSVPAQPNVSQASLQVHQNAQGLQVQQNPTHRLLMGQPNEVRIEVVNNSPTAMRQVAVTDTLPEIVNFLQASDKGMFHWSTRTVQWLIDLAPGQVKVLTMQIQPLKAGQWTHEVQARLGVAPEVRSTGLFLAEGHPNLTIRIAGRDAHMEVGKETVYEIRVINHGSAPATNVEVAAILSDGLVVGHAQGTTKHRSQGKQITFAPLPTLNPQAEAVYHIGVTAQAPGDRRVRVQVSSDQLPTPVTREERTLVYRD